MQFAETADQRIVLFETLAEAEAGIKHDALAANPGEDGLLGPVFQFTLHQQNDIPGRRQRAPFLGTSAHVHQDRAAFEIGDGLGHLPVPAKAADVVHNLSAGAYGGAGHAGFVGVDGEKRGRNLFLQFGDDGKDAPEFFFYAHRGSAGREFRTLRLIHRLRRVGANSGTGACRFTADVDDIGSFFEQTLCVGDGLIAVEELATIGKRIRGDVYDAHDQGALAEFERARTETPLEDGPHGD